MDETQNNKQPIDPTNQQPQTNQVNQPPIQPTQPITNNLNTPTPNNSPQPAPQPTQQAPSPIATPAPAPVVQPAAAHQPQQPINPNPAPQVIQPQQQNQVFQPSSQQVQQNMMPQPSPQPMQQSQQIMTGQPVQPGQEQTQKKLKKSIVKAIAAVFAVSLIGVGVIIALGFGGQINLAERELITENNFQVEIPIGWESVVEDGAVLYSPNAADLYSEAVVVATVDNTIFQPGEIATNVAAFPDQKAFADDFVGTFSDSLTSGNDLTLSNQPNAVVDSYTQDLVQLSIEFEARNRLDQKFLAYSDLIINNEGQFGYILVGVLEEADVELADIEEILESFSFR